MKLVFIAAVLLLLGALSQAQSTAPVRNTQLIEQDSALIINDLLDVGIRELVQPDAATHFLTRVDPSGKINLPLIKGPAVKGMSIQKAEEAIAKEYRDANLLRRAKVTVVRTESGSKPSITSAPISKGDNVEVMIADLERPGSITSTSPAVSDEGTVKLPVLKKPVAIASLTESQADVAIQAAYRDANIVRNAIVHVRRVARLAGE